MINVIHNMVNGSYVSSGELFSECMRHGLNGAVVVALVFIFDRIQ